MQAKVWREQDTDSESDPGTPGSDSSGAEAQKWSFVPGIGGPSAQDDGGDRGVSPEEFTRLQDELLALKMHNAELLSENRRLCGPSAASPPAHSGGGGALPAVPALPGGALALRKQLSSQFKTSADVFSSFHARGVASFQSTLANVAQGGQAGSMKSSPSPPCSPDALADELDEQDREALRAEADYLKSRVRASLEEAEEFRAVAADAQQVLNAAERAAGAARALAPELPGLEELRAKVADLNDEGPAVDKEALAALSDPLLTRLAEAALGLLRPARTDEADEGVKGREQEDDEETLLLKRKVEANQQQLKRLLEVFHKQQAQIVKLRERVFPNEESSKNKELRRETKEKLREAELQVEEWAKQLEASEQSASRSQELRARLRGAAGEAMQRDQILAEMRAMFEMQELEVALSRERLRTTLADIAGYTARRAEAAGAGVSPRRRAAAAGSPAYSLGGASPSFASNAAPIEEVVAFAEAGVQAELNEGDDLATIRERRRLLTELGDIRVAKAVLEKRTARELQELRALFPKPKPRPKPKAAPPPPAPRPRAAGGAPLPPPGAAGGGGISTSAVGASAPPGQGPQVVAFDISSDGEEPDGSRRRLGFELPTDEVELPGDAEAEPEYSEEQLLMQRIEELEDRTDNLRHELDMMYQAEKALQAQNKEKSQLLVYLLERADALRAPPTGAAAVVGKAVFLPPGTAGAEAQRQQQQQCPSMQRQEPRGTSEEDIVELERIVEEVQEDNIRVRNDIKIMSDEFRRVLASLARQ